MAGLFQKEPEYIMEENREEYIVEMRHITKRFPGIVANDDVTIQVRKGEIYALLGENGAGKSTLIKILSGSYDATEGELFMDGQKLTLRAPLDAQKAGISVVMAAL